MSLCNFLVIAFLDFELVTYVHNLLKRWRLSLGTMLACVTNVAGHIACFQLGKEDLFLEIPSLHFNRERVDGLDNTLFGKLRYVLDIFHRFFSVLLSHLCQLLTVLEEFGICQFL